MTNLTEQNLSKKNGKTFFYIKLPNGEVIQGDEFALGLYRMCNEGDKVKMLEQVPDYELWKAVNEQWKVLLEENAKLKELLKEVNDYLPEFEMPMTILAKIDEVLK